MIKPFACLVWMFTSCGALATEPLLPLSCEVSADGATWCAIRDFGSRQQGLGMGTGSFLTFQSYNQAGVLGDWAFLNGGLLDRTSGKEQGDLDLLVYINGRPSGIAIQGNVADQPAAVLPMYDKEMDIGRQASRFRDIYLSGRMRYPEAPPCPYGFPVVSKQILGCLPVQLGTELGFVPIYRVGGTIPHEQSETFVHPR